MCHCSARGTPAAELHPGVEGPKSARWTPIGLRCLCPGPVVMVATCFSGSTIKFPSPSPHPATLLSPVHFLLLHPRTAFGATLQRTVDYIKALLILYFAYISLCFLSL